MNIFCASKAAFAAMLLGGVCSASQTNSCWWVSDEELEFVKQRTTHIDFEPGTPEGNAKRFYSNRERTEYVEFNYDESKAGEGTYTLEDPLTFIDGRKVKNASVWVRPPH